MSQLRQRARSLLPTPPTAIILTMLLIPAVVAIVQAGALEPASSAPAKAAADNAQLGEAVGVRDALWGPARAVAMDEARVYVGAGRRVVVVDDGAPGGPEVVARGPLLSGPVVALAVDGARIYAALGEDEATGAGEPGVALLEYRAPDELVLTARWAGRCAPRALAAEGAWLLVACGRDGMRLLDVSDPATPRSIETPDLEVGGVVFDVAVEDGVALAVGDHITQIALDAAGGGVRVVGETSESVRAVAISEGVAIFAGIWDCEMQVAVLGESLEIDFVYREEPCWDFADLVLDGDRLLAIPDEGSVGDADAWEAGTVLVYELGAGSLELGGMVPAVPTGTTPSALAIHGERAAVVGPSGLTIVSLPPDPRSASAVELEPDFSGASLLALSAGGDAVYVAEGERVVVYDIADPSRPSLVDELELSDAEPMAMLVEGELLFVAVDHPSDLVRIFDLRDPLAPRLTGLLPLPAETRVGPDSLAMAAARDFLYIQASEMLDEIILVVDVADPTLPSVAGKFALWSGFATDKIGLLAVDDWLWIALPEQADVPGLLAVDTRDKGRPRHAGTLWMPELDSQFDSRSSLPMVWWKDHLLLTGWGLHVVDVADPAAMRVVGWSGLHASGLWGDGERVFAQGPIGLVELDLELPARPVAKRLLEPFTPLEGVPYTIRGAQDVLAVGNDYGWAAVVDVEPLDRAPRVAARDARFAASSRIAVQGGRVWTIGREHVRTTTLTGAPPVAFAAGSPVDMPVDTRDLSLAGGRVFVAAGQAGLLEYEADAEGLPREVARASMYDGTWFFGSVTGVVGDVNSLLVHNAWGVRLVDLSLGRTNLRPPLHNPELGMSGPIVAADFVGGRLALANEAYRGGPPSITGMSLRPGGAIHAEPVTATLPTVATAVRIVGPAIYAVGEGMGLRIVDLAEGRVGPAVAGVPLRGATAMALQDDRLWVAGGEGRGWVRVLDVSDPSAPRLVGRHETLGRIEDIAVDPATGAVVAIDAIDGQILLDEPALPLRVGAYLPLAQVGP